MFDPVIVHDSISVLAQAEIFNTAPTAPPGAERTVSAIVGWAKWLGFIMVGVGLIVMGGAMAVSRREGSSEEVTSNAIRIGAAAMILGAVGSILSLLIGS